MNFNFAESNESVVFIKNVKSQNPVLSQNELLELVEKAKEGDRSARDKIILSNFGLIEKIARQCNVPQVSLEDKFQTGLERFIQLIDSFDPARCPFLSSYVWLPVQQAIYKEYLRMPEKLFRFSSKMIKVREFLYEEFGRKPSYSEMAEAMNVPESYFAKKMAEISMYNTGSLDACKDSEDDSSAYYFQEDKNAKNPEEAFFFQQDSKNISWAMDFLEESEKELISLSHSENNPYGKKLSFREIGALYGVSHQTVGNRLAKAEAHLRSALSRYGIEK